MVYKQPGCVRDWYDDYIEEAEKMNFYVVSDWHLNHGNIKTYCQRPNNFTELIVKRHNEVVTDNDIVFMLGDVCIGKKADGVALIRQMKGRKILVRGNHDRDKSNGWWMENGFDFSCDSFRFRNVLFTHEPYVPQYKAEGWPAEEPLPEEPGSFTKLSLPDGAEFNVHGHLHNVWDGFKFNGDSFHSGVDIINVATGKPFEADTKLWYPWQRLFAIEYTDYRPVELDKFLARPERYQAAGPRRKNEQTS